jgi:hypothetical protein
MFPQGPSVCQVHTLTQEWSGAGTDLAWAACIMSLLPDVHVRPPFLIMPNSLHSNRIKVGVKVTPSAIS